MSLKRLNEDSKVLSPEELLYRCVEAVNFTHNPRHAQMDIKLRFSLSRNLSLIKGTRRKWQIWGSDEWFSI